MGSATLSPRPRASCSGGTPPAPASGRGENFSRCDHRHSPLPTGQASRVYLSIGVCLHPRFPPARSKKEKEKKKIPRTPETKRFLLARRLQNCKRMFCAIPLRRLLQGGGGGGVRKT